MIPTFTLVDSTLTPLPSPRCGVRTKTGARADATCRNHTEDLSSVVAGRASAAPTKPCPLCGPTPKKCQKYAREKY
jgi:hypothetical protein